MLVFKLEEEQAWNLGHHVEKVLAQMGGGDVSIACWEPDQVSPYHCHPNATEIYFCVSGHGKMRTPAFSVDMVAGSFALHPPGELHEFSNGPQRTVLFRVRYGANMHAHHLEWRGNPSWKQSPADAEYFRSHAPE
jgi:mannose-6-phosphate isomerase-like protein (cupin superfamily)